MDMIDAVRNTNDPPHRAVKPAIPLIGVHDALSARIAIQQFEKFHSVKDDYPSLALFVSGFGVSASRLGQPDAGILTRSDIEDATRNVLQHSSRKDRKSVSKIPVIMDGDTGFGGASNLRQTVRRAAALGAAALSIEDQVFPKRCTYVAGSSVNIVERSQAVDRIKTAVAARQEALEQDGNEILLIGRTDCRMALGFAEAQGRCLAFEELGADIVYAENLQDDSEYENLRSTISCPIMLAQVQTGLSGQRLRTLQEIGEDLGYELALWGVTGLQAAVAAMNQAMLEFLETGGPISSTELSSLDDVKDLVGFSDLDDFEGKYPCV